jgi:LuxR family maltose regulon positive regulatory protein
LRDSFDLRELDAILRARVVIAAADSGCKGPTGGPDAVGQVVDELETMHRSAVALGRNGRGLQMLLLLALGYRRAGDQERSEAALARAVDQAEPERHVLSFTELGAPMAEMLYSASSAGSCGEYAGEVLAGFPTTQQAQAYSKTPVDTVEPLSHRELEVLRFLARGLANKEIADGMCISLRTVKWHTSNIYGKIGAANRTQAVARARSLGILPGV